ncbi:MAG: DUF4124 domain-containing protein [Desulfobacterales bacterium]|nr:DUF4124 domain-containing protein [Desulfobacterales bacterium]
MKLLKWILICGGVLLAVPCWAEFYKYIDPQGNVHFTDDLTRVPANQLGSLRSYGGQGGVAQLPAGSRPVSAPSPTSPPLSAAGGERGQSAARGEYDPSEQSRKQALEKDYQTLLEEKASLEKEKEQVGQKSRVRRNSSAKALNKKIQALNAEIEDFKKRADFPSGAEPSAD